MAPGPGLKQAAVSSAALAVLLVKALPQYSIRASIPRTFLLLLAIAIVARVIWKVVLWPKMFSPLRHLPGPDDGSFFHGQFWRIAKDMTGQPMREWINSIPNDGLIRYTMFGNTERIFVTDPKGLAEVLVTRSYEFVKPEDTRRLIARVAGMGVLVAEGEEHKMQRKHLMPAFAYRHIKDLYQIFWSKSCEMVRIVTSENEDQNVKAGEKAQDGTVVSFGDWLSRLTLDIIGTAGMGFDFKAIHNPDTELNVHYRRIFAPSSQARYYALLSTLIPVSLLCMLPLKRNHEITEATTVIRKVSRELIRENQAKMKEKRERVDKDIISVALESGGFTEDNLVDQTMTFLAAGHETTASAINWALVALCQHPEMQSRLRKEVRANLPSPDDTSAVMTAEMMDQLPYLHAVCSEVLRIYAPVPLTRRMALKTTTLLGQVIPKGTDVMLVTSAINVSKALWGEDALEFNPERWMGPGRSNSGGAVSNFANMTFLHGPRSCIGQAFAKSEFACILAAIVGRFEMELEPRDRVIEVQSGITIKPKGGLDLRMKALEGW